MHFTTLNKASGRKPGFPNGAAVMRRVKRAGRLGGLGAAACLVLAATPALAQNTAADPSGDSAAVLAMNDVDQSLQLTLGHSRLLQADAPLGTIIVGDDTIAAATIGADNSVILTGRTAGLTNLIILSEEGAMLMASQIAVVPVAGPLRSTVTVLRGSAREQYECRGNSCEPVSADETGTERPLVLMAAPDDAAEPAPPEE